MSHFIRSSNKDGPLTLKVSIKVSRNIVSLERSEKKQMDHATKYSAEVDVASFFVGSDTENKKGGRHMMRRY
jgi:hypothetical protein